MEESEDPEFLVEMLASTIKGSSPVPDHEVFEIATPIPDLRVW